MSALRELTKIQKQLLFFPRHDHLRVAFFERYRSRLFRKSTYPSGYSKSEWVEYGADYERARELVEYVIFNRLTDERGGAVATSLAEFDAVIDGEISYRVKDLPPYYQSSTLARPQHESTLRAHKHRRARELRLAEIMKPDDE